MATRFGGEVKQQSLNALQTILIRERLILYVDHRRQRDGSFSMRELIEAIAFSEANAGKPSIYSEERDTGERYDAGFTLKNNTIGNFLARKASSTTEEHLRLLRDFLAHEGFLSPALLRLAVRHPDPWLAQEFAGIAPSDPRLQRHRYELEGEYLRGTRSGRFSQLWIAAPGRSKPFVTLRVAAVCPACESRPSLKCLSHDGGPPDSAAEGRIFLMPGKTLVLVEVSYPKGNWSGGILRVEFSEHGINLIDASARASGYDRVYSTNCATSERSRYNVRDAIRASYVLSREQMESRRPTIRMGDFRKEQARALYKKPRRHQKRLDKELLTAAASGDAPAVLYALIRGANPNARDTNTERTAAHLAAAANSLAVIRTLTADAQSEQAVLHDYHGGRTLDEESSAAWRNARSARDPLAVDDAEKCYASAFAPIGFDASPRSREALEIWRTLMPLEMAERTGDEYYGRLAHLAFWKPSSVMTNAILQYPLARRGHRRK